MAHEPDFAAVELVGESIDDHRRPGYEVGVDWIDEGELNALRERVAALREVDRSTRSKRVVR
jgi:hypothetical protein